MAGFLNTGQILRVKAYCALGAQVSQNTRLWRVESVTTPLLISVATAMAQFNTRFKPLYTAAMSQDAQYRGVTGQLVSPVAYDVTVESDPAFGAVAADPLPPQVAGLVKYTTQIAGRMNRGRHYFPFFPETWNASTGRPDANADAALLALGTGWGTSITITQGGDNALLVPMIFPADTGIGRVITGVVPRTDWATMRSRSNFSAANKSPV